MFTASQPGWHLRASKITSRSSRAQRRRRRESRSAPASSTALATLNYWSRFKAHTGRSDVATPHINSTLIIKRDSCLFFLKKTRRNGLNSDLWWLGISAPSARWTTLLSGSSPACRRSSKRGKKKEEDNFQRVLQRLRNFTWERLQRQELGQKMSWNKSSNKDFFFFL